jgi:hypothetical protein
MKSLHGAQMHVVTMGDGGGRVGGAEVVEVIWPVRRGGRRTERVEAG